MKVLHVSQFDSGNGSSWAMNRLHHALRDQGIDSNMWVQRALSEKKHIYSDRNLFSRVRPHLEKFYKLSTRKFYDYNYSTACLPRKKVPWKLIESCDVIHMHWINGGFIPLPLLAQIKKPIVWTFHDLWAMTGLVHYPKINCNADVYSLSDDWGEEMLESKLDREIFQKKKEIVADLKICGIAPSSWAKKNYSQSSIWKDKKVYLVKNTIQTNLFRPGAKSEARKRLGIKTDKPLILFGAMSALSDERKGCLLVEKVLRLLKFREIEAEILIFGESQNNMNLDLSLPVNFLGKIFDSQRLIEVYRAADVMMVPSVQDNFPNTIVESICCGLPVVAYNVGGIGDMIEEGQTGSLVAPFSVESFVDRITDWLADGRSINENEMNRFREAVSPEKIATKHLRIYERMLVSEKE